MNKYRQIKNLPIIFDLVGNVDGFIKDFQDLEVERVLHAEKVLSMRVNDIRKVTVEQEIVFKKERFIVTRVEENKDNDGLKYTILEAQSAFVELGRSTRDGKFTVIAKTADYTLGNMLIGTNWVVGVVEELEDGVPLVSVDEKDVSVLALLSVLVKITGYEIDFDTVNRVVNLRRRVGKRTNEVVRYKNNLKSIKRTIEPPTATIIHPRGRDGLTIASVNNGATWLEDFSYYTDVLGIPTEIAKQKYTKEYIYSDERFVYARNLKDKARSMLDDFSKPLVSYETTVESLTTNEVTEGDFLYVIDEDLGVKQEVRIVRIVDKLFREYENQIELNRMQEGLGESDYTNLDANSDAGKVQLIVADNNNPVTFNQNFSNILEVAMSTYADSNLLAHISIILKTTGNSSLIEFYVDVGGERATPVFKNTVPSNSYHTISVSTPLLRVQDGTRFVSIMAKSSQGGVTSEVQEVQLVIEGTSILGGEGTKLPKANIVENISYGGLLDELKDEVVITKGDES